MLKLVEGNLLEAEADALVNTVNTVGVMGKGVALQFSKKFPEIVESYKLACASKTLRPGTLHVFERADFFKPRYIINFPTKRHWRRPSRIEDIEDGLKALVQEIQIRNIRSIAVPPLGCGNGGLDWKAIFPLIREYLGNLNGVDVMVFPPKGAPAAEEIEHRTSRPHMTPSRAIVLKVLQQYFALGYSLTLLEVHKLLYFLQEAGEPLRLRFEKQTYGPYADNIRHVLHRFEGHFTIGFADGRNKPDTPIELQPGAIKEADAYLDEQAESSQQSRRRLTQVARLIEGFESPYGMELLATVHWVAKHEDAGGVGDVVKGVHSWNARKQRIMSPPHIRLAYERLASNGWI